MTTHWECSVCMLHNVLAHTVCSACFSDKDQKGADDSTWVCTVCTCVNESLLAQCDACTTPRIIHGETQKEIKVTTIKGETWICVKCTFVNENLVSKCIVCEEGTKPATALVKETTSYSIVKEGADTKVVVTKSTVATEVKGIKADQKIEEKKVDKGKQKVEEQEYEEEEEDEEMSEGGDEEMYEGGEGEEEIVDEYADYENAYADEAYDAMTDTPYDVLIQNPAHVDKKKSFLPPVYELQALTVLNNMQTTALRHMVEASKKLSLAAHAQLEVRVRKLGYTPEQLQDTLRYIRDSAPILIHVKLATYLDKLLNDTHYRNQFETNTSSGTLSRPTRIEWENRMFSNNYSASSDFDRVKYGVLNITRDPQGVRSCASYGESYLLLKNVRLRTTFASCDTSNAHVQISCCEYYEHVLATYTDPELSDLIAVATDPQGLMWKANVNAQYKEIQIHGPVELSKNVEAVVVNGQFRKDKNMCSLLERFAAKNKCNILWMDDLQ